MKKFLKTMLNPLAKLFFGVENTDEMAKRGLTMGISVSALIGFDFLVVCAIGESITVALLKRGWQEFAIWIALSVINLVPAFVVMRVSDKTKSDPTLCEAARRLTSASISHFAPLGILFEVLISGPMVIWEGPAGYGIYIRPRISSKLGRVITFVAISFLQMTVWTKAYIFGYGVIQSIMLLF